MTKETGALISASAVHTPIARRKPKINDSLIAFLASRRVVSLKVSGMMIPP